MKAFRNLAALLAAAALTVPLTACEMPDREATERWTATADTNVAIDWDKVNEAYKKAAGPEDFEKKVNEIYEGSELISVHVQDLDEKTQVVTGFFDKNTDGQVGEDEKVFTIRRDITQPGEGQYAIEGHGHYAGYHSPVMSLVSGMVLGSMVSSMFSPRYVPVYVQPYATSPNRHSELRNQRQSYRAANPSRFRGPSSKSTGKSYGGGSRGGGFRGSRGGGRFGLARAGRAVRPRRLDA